MITPEVAAFVVKEYLLPMFESDGKKLLSRKGKSRTRGGTTEHFDGSVSQMTQPIDDLMNKDYSTLKAGEGGISGKVAASMPGIGTGNNKTVFSELKLSEILLQDIDIYKDQIKSKDKIQLFDKQSFNINKISERRQKDKIEKLNQKYNQNK